MKTRLPRDSHQPFEVQKKKFQHGFFRLRALYWGCNHVAAGALQWWCTKQQPRKDHEEHPATLSPMHTKAGSGCPAADSCFSAVHAPGRPTAGVSTPGCSSGRFRLLKVLWGSLGFEACPNGPSDLTLCGLPMDYPHDRKRIHATGCYHKKHSAAIIEKFQAVFWKAHSLDGFQCERELLKILFHWYSANLVFYS